MWCDGGATAVVLVACDVIWRKCRPAEHGGEEGLVFKVDDKSHLLIIHDLTLVAV